LSNKFKRLPRTGGIDEQDAILIDYFKIIIDQENIERKIELNRRRAEMLAAGR